MCTVYTVRGFYLNVGLLQVVGPSGEQVLPHLLLKVAGIGDERRREQTVSGDGGHLVLEGLAGLLPAVPFSGQTLQKGCAAIHLGRRWVDVQRVKERGRESEREIDRLSAVGEKTGLSLAISYLGLHSSQVSFNGLGL